MPRHFGRLTMLGVALTTAMPAFATTWTPVTRTAEGAALSIDEQSIEARDGWVRVWVQFDFSRVRSRAERGLVLLKEFNCNGRYARIVASRFYAPDGQVTATDTRPSAYAEVRPGSVDERIGRHVCAMGAAGASHGGETRDAGDGAGQGNGAQRGGGDAHGGPAGRDGRVQ